MTRRSRKKDWIDASWTPRFLNSSFNTRHDYGYLWWHTRYAGHSAWFAWGYGGQFLFVLPSLSAIVVFTGDPDALAEVTMQSMTSWSGRSCRIWLNALPPDSTVLGMASASQ